MNATGRHPTDYDRAIGVRIREARLALGLSQKDVADAIGVSYQQLQKYESGGDRIPPARIELLVTILHRPISWFFPRATDVRASGESEIAKFLSSNDGYKVASKWPRLSQEARAIILKLVEHMAKGNTP